MWRKALQIIPKISKEEWDELDLVSRWLIATRAAVLVTTFLSALLAGIFAFRAGEFKFWPWLLVTIGLYLAHGTNNFINDYTDFVRGVDEDNYYRAQYGPHPLLHGLMTKKELLTYAAITGAVAAACGVALGIMRGEYTWLLMALGAFFVLFYTLPVVLGETLARWTMTILLIVEYLMVIYLIFTHFFTPVMLLVLAALPILVKIWPILSNPKPDEKPEDFPDVWPNYYVAAAFHHTRHFGGWFILAVIADTVVKLIWPGFWG